MTVRPPSNFAKVDPTILAYDMLGHEIMAEKASALGRAGEAVEKTLAALRAFDAGSAELGGPERITFVKQAAEAVYAYFIQRELCGFRRHQDVIREYAIPRDVLARLGAK